MLLNDAHCLCNELWGHTVKYLRNKLLKYQLALWYRFQNSKCIFFYIWKKMDYSHMSHISLSDLCEQTFQLFSLGKLQREKTLCQCNSSIILQRANVAFELFLSQFFVKYFVQKSMCWKIYKRTLSEYQILNYAYHDECLCYFESKRLLLIFCKHLIHSYALFWTKMTINVC